MISMGNLQEMRKKHENINQKTHTARSYTMTQRQHIIKRARERIYEAHPEGKNKKQKQHHQKISNRQEKEPYKNKTRKTYKKRKRENQTKKKAKHSTQGTTPAPDTQYKKQKQKKQIRTLVTTNNSSQGKTPQAV